MRPSHCAIQLKGGQGAPCGDTGDGTSLLEKAGGASSVGQVGAGLTRWLCLVWGRQALTEQMQLDLSTNVCVLEIGSLGIS